MYVQLGNEINDMNSEVNFLSNNHKRGTICVLRKCTGTWQALKVLAADPLDWIGCFSYLGDTK